MRRRGRRHPTGRRSRTGSRYCPPRAACLLDPRSAPCVCLLPQMRWLPSLPDGVMPACTAGAGAAALHHSSASADSIMVTALVFCFFAFGVAVIWSCLNKSNQQIGKSPLFCSLPFVWHAGWLTRAAQWLGCR